MKKLQINIFDTDLNWYGMVEEVQSLILHSSWHEVVNSELHVSKSAQGVEELQIGRILIVNGENDKAVIIEDRTTSLSEHTWTYSLIPLKGIMNYRVAHPTYSTPWTNTAQAQIMMQLPWTQLISVSDPDRMFPHFGITDLKTYGNAIDYTPDWSYLGDAITTIAKQSDIPIGWNIYVDWNLNGFVMDTYKATDRSVNQSALNPVVFSEDFGNIKDSTYFDSIKDWVNVTYLKWDDGADTPVNHITGVGNTSNGATVGFNRKELAIDSDQKTSTAVIAQGNSEMNQRPKVMSFTAEVIDNPNTMSTYNKDWFLGDIVTIQSRELGVSIDVQVTQLEEVYENGLYTLNPTFGEGKLSFITLIKNAIKSR